MHVGVLGDVMGRPGRQAVKALVPGLREQYNLAAVIANGENLADGVGCTAATAKEMLRAGVDALTLGNHAWAKREFMREIVNFPTIIRPSNFPEGQPGTGHCILKLSNGCRLGLVNLIGRVFMQAVNCPFRAADQEVEALAEDTDLILVDMHAEATSEKVAMGWYLDGRVAGVYGTHTHVPTADARLLPYGTAYITDIGMTGGVDSVIGMEVEPVLERFTTGMPIRFRVAAGNTHLRALILDLDAQRGTARGIQWIDVPVDES